MRNFILDIIANMFGLPKRWEPADRRGAATVIAMLLIGPLVTIILLIIARVTLFK